VILADTSVWIDHFRRGTGALAAELELGRLVMHPFVLGELALGSLRDRAATLELLRNLAACTVASDDEVHFLIESRRLMSRGLGWIDAHLLASVAISGGQLWTLDRRLHEAARSLGLSWT
jgi:predicted nucleic acid-binding protein